MKDTMGMLVAAVVVVLLGFGAYYLWRSPEASTLPPGESSVAPSPSPVVGEPGGPLSVEVSFTATDGYSLSGTYSVPLAGSPIKMPVVVLVHDAEKDRSEFAGFTATLLDQGYAVLAYDSRGAGKSAGGAADRKDYVKDLSGALTFLSTQKEVDSSEVGVVGAGIGAHVAYVAAGSAPEVKAAVALSPLSMTGLPKELLGTGLTGFSPDALFVGSDEKEKAAADALYKKVKDPKQQRVYQGAGRGAALLGDDKALQDILSFISQYLDVKG